MNESKKKRYRVVGVPYGKGVVDYARRLEDAMNEMGDEGLTFQITDHKTGSVIIGRRDEPAAQEHPLARLLELRHARELEADVSFSPRTKELLMRTEGLSGFGQDVDVFIDAVKKNATSLTRGYGTEELRVAAREFTEAVNKHEHTECMYARILRALATLAHETVRVSVQ